MQIRLNKTWPWLLAAMMGTLQMLAVRLTPALAYVHDAVAHGEVWRLFTASFIHLNWPHYAMNGVALILMVQIFRDAAEPKQQAATLVISGVAAHAGLFVLGPSETMSSVVGLSGALHGLFAAGAIAMVVAKDRWGPWLLAALVGKLFGERFFTGITPTSDLIGGPVAYDAHVFGALGGTLVAFFFASEIYRRQRNV